jgi:hypothetical protein
VSTKTFARKKSRNKRKRTVNCAGRFLFASVPRLFGAIGIAVAGLCFVTTTAAQNSAVSASVPNGTATNEVVRLALPDTIAMALRYNLGTIENAENVRGQIDYDVRTAFLNLNAAKEQVDVAQKNVVLANESLTHSKDRFTSGVTDSVEVVQSEQSLASANDQYITSVYNHNLAKLALARALGVARTSYNQYLGGK